MSKLTNKNLSSRATEERVTPGSRAVEDRAIPQSASATKLAAKEARVRLATDAKVIVAVEALAAQQQAKSPEEFGKLVGNLETSIYPVLRPFGYQGSKATPSAMADDFNRAYAQWSEERAKVRGDTSTGVRAPLASDRPDPKHQMWQAAAEDPLQAVYIGLGAGVSELLGSTLGFEQDPEKAAAGAKVASNLATVGSGFAGIGNGQKSSGSNSGGRQNRRTPSRISDEERGLKPAEVPRKIPRSTLPLREPDALPEPVVYEKGAQRVDQPPDFPEIIQSRGAERPRKSPPQVHVDEFASHEYPVAASAQTPRGVKTAVIADAAEQRAYLTTLLTGPNRIGIQKPSGSNIPGADFITAEMLPSGKWGIVVYDAKSRTSDKSRFPVAKWKEAWRNEVTDALRRFDVGNPKLEAAIQAASNRGDIFFRQVNIDLAPSGQGQIRYGSLQPLSK